MNTEKLAHLLYPNISKTIQDYENFYPKRNLSPKQEVTRSAPSPTGYMHFGNFFAAFLDWQIARATNGVFYFRLEDTDKKREVKGSGLVAIKILKDYGIQPNEGLTVSGDEKGDYGPYTQSKRTEIYHTFAKHLVAKGKAFPCFCEKTDSIEEIKVQREKTLLQANQIETKDPCRNLTFDEIKNYLNAGKHFAIRLKSAGNPGDKIQAHDIVRGTRTLEANSKDIVLVKSDGIPPYAFAHAVVDYLMQTTMVVRGEEWYVSYPAHLEIFNAFGFAPPKYLHNPIILKIDEETGNKRKLSKRKDPEADMRYFSKVGYPKHAVIEYLLTLANSNFEIWKLQNPQKSIFDFEFSAEKIGSSNPMFDIMKLNDISKNYISTLSAKQVYDFLLDYTKQYDKQFFNALSKNKPYAIKVLSIDREGKNPRKDFAKWSDFKTFFAYMFDFAPLNKISDFDLENINTASIIEVLQQYRLTYKASHTKQEWFENVKSLCDNLGYATNNKQFKQNPENFKGTVADACNFVRIAITGKQNAPDLHTISQILGDEKVKQRLETLKNLLTEQKQ